MLHIVILSLLITLDGLFSVKTRMDHVAFDECYFSDNTGIMANLIYLNAQ